MHSSDGGITWEYEEKNIEGILMDIYFIDEKRGWIAGGTPASEKYKAHNDGSGIILYTDDGGKNWKIVFRSLRPGK